MLRRLFLAIVVLVVVAIVVIFWGLNPGNIALDFGFIAIESQIPAAFVGAFVAGWIFGLVCLSLFVLKLVNERRRLRKQLRLAETEVSTLRNLPMQGATE